MELWISKLFNISFHFIDTQIRQKIPERQDKLSSRIIFLVNQKVVANYKQNIQRRIIFRIFVLQRTKIMEDRGFEE